METHLDFTVDNVENLIDDSLGGGDILTDSRVIANAICSKFAPKKVSLGDIEVVLLGWFDCEMNNKNIMNIAKAIHVLYEVSGERRR